MSLESFFRVLGETCGRRPLVPVFLYLFLASVGCIGWHWARYGTEREGSYLWTYALGNGALELDCMFFLRKTDPFKRLSTLLFMLGKDGGSVLQIAHVDETLEFYKQFVNTTGYSWANRETPFRTYDITERALGSIPDTHSFDGGFPVFPGIHLIQMWCFAEMAESLNTCAGLPSDVLCVIGYHTLDAFLYLVLPLSVNVASSSEARPQYRALLSSDFKAVISPGCAYFTKNVYWPPWMWGGGSEPTMGEIVAGSRIVDMSAMLQIKSMEAPRRIQFRLALAQPMLAAFPANDLRFLRNAHSVNYLYEFALPSRAVAEFLDPASLSPQWGNELTAQTYNIQWALLIAGQVMMLGFVEWSFCDFGERLRSHAACASFAFTCVGLSLISTGFGVYHWLQLPTGGANVGVTPFLGMGLGVNDMFVLLIGFASLGPARIVAETYVEILGDVVGHGGEGVTLTTLCNFSSFAVAAMIPIVGIQLFVFQCSMVAIGNWLVVMSVFVPRLADEARRMKAGLFDISIYACVCFCQMSKPANADIALWGAASLQFIHSVMTPLALRPLGWVLSFVLSLAVVVVAIVAIPQQPAGWVFADLVPHSTNMERAMINIQENFCIWENWHFYHCTDVPNKQFHMLELHHQMILPIAWIYADFSPSLVDMFSLTLLGFGYLWTADYFPGICEEGWELLNPDATCLASWLGNSPWLFGLFGIVGLPPPNQFYRMYAQWSTWPATPFDALNPANQGYSDADGLGTFEWCFDVQDHMTYAYDKWWILNIADMFEWQECIEEIRIVTNTNVELAGRVVLESPFVAFFEIFGVLTTVFSKCLAVVGAVVFLLTLLMLRSLSAAGAGTFMDVMLVIQVWGVSALWAANNQVIVTYYLIGFGISVEFTAHCIAYFNATEGDALQRLRVAMKATIPAVFLGGVSTILAICPTIFYPLRFGLKNTFGIFAVLQFLGFWNGLYVLPCLLACVAFVFGLCGFKFERVSSKRNSGTAATQQPTVKSETSMKDDYDIECEAASISPVRTVNTAQHF